MSETVIRYGSPFGPVVALYMAQSPDMQTSNPDTYTLTTGGDPVIPGNGELLTAHSMAVQAILAVVRSLCSAMDDGEKLRLLADVVLELTVVDDDEDEIAPPSAEGK